MTTEDVKRKLSAILSADVQGYSWLMGDDEKATVETITVYREVMTGLIKGRRGKVVDAKGDNVLAEFSSVVDAIDCAVEIQKELENRNADLPEDRRMTFRIGVNLGDVIEKAGTVIGERSRLKMWHWTAIFGLAVLIMVAGILGLWEFYVRPDVAPASVEKMAYPLPDKPSIAVLPFDNMSKDPEQDYFCDGITEEIITALAKVPGLFVIARNSTFTYKGKPVKIQKVAEDLGVRYVLEGSVRKSGERVRITAQLIDAISGKHLWAEKYDRPLKDIFAVQDAITFKILESLHIKISSDDITRACSRGTDNIDAYLKMIQARHFLYRQNIEGNSMVRKLSEEALALDPKYSTAYCVLAFSYMMDVFYGSSKSPKESIAKAFELTKKSISSEPSCPMPYLTLSWCYLFIRQHAKAIAACKQAVDLDPNFSMAYAFLALVLCYAGEPDEALVSAERSIRINPKPPSFFYMYLGMAYYQKDMYEKAVSALKKGLSLQPNAINILLRLATCYSSMGREDDAHAEVSRLLKLNPKLSLAYLAKMYPYKNK